MKRLVVLIAVLGLIVGSVATADAAKKKKKAKPRVAEGTYANPAIGIPGVVGSAAAGGAVEFPILPTESFVSVEITDDGGQPVIATMSQDTDPSTPTWEIFATICGKTDGAVEIAPGVALRVSVYTIPGPDHPTCTGPATSGTIKATFSSVP